VFGQPETAAARVLVPIVRGAIKRFSADSRRRLLKHVARIDLENLGYRPMFITLTYPDKWADSSAVWKRHIEAMRKRLEREYGQHATLWKLEFQKRGAPHFHLIWFRRTSVGEIRKLRRNLSVQWAAVVGSGDEKHIYAGVQADFARSKRGVMFYASKYAAKLDGIEREVGRRWGLWNWAMVPTRRLVIQLAPGAYHAVRRVLKRLRVKNGARVHISSDVSGMWAFVDGSEFARYVEWFVSTGGNDGLAAELRE